MVLVIGGEFEDFGSWILGFCPRYVLLCVQVAQAIYISDTKNCAFFQPPIVPSVKDPNPSDPFSLLTSDFCIEYHV